jgi:hypothetical protein
MFSMVCPIYQPFCAAHKEWLQISAPSSTTMFASKSGIAGALEQYNLDQFVTVDAPDETHQARSTPPVAFSSLTIVLQVIISGSGRVGDPKENRFIDPRSKKSFVFDHLRLVSQCAIVTCWILTHLHRRH